MGWGFIKALARLHDLWVITEQEKFQHEIEDWTRTHPNSLENVRFFFIRKQRHRTLRKIWPPSYYWFYKTWHLKAMELAKSLDRNIGFDVLHQLNMVGFREPGYLWRLEAPFVWGPIGGFTQVPWRFLPMMGPQGCLYQLGYNTFNSAHIHMLIRPRLAAKRAGKGLIAATSDTAAKIRHYWGKEAHVMCEVGPPGPIAQTFSKRQPGEPLRLVWSGRHVSHKALPLLLEAMAQAPRDLKWVLEILGNGIETAKWKRLAKDLGIFDHCVWHGWIPRQNALHILKTGHLFIITSLKDLTSTVIIEALSLGSPVICLDHCGFSDVVTPECGIKIPVTTPRKIARDIAVAITALSTNEMKRRKLAAGALRRANHFSWEAKARRLAKIYHQVIKEWKIENTARS